MWRLQRKIPSLNTQKKQLNDAHIKGASLKFLIFLSACLISVNFAYAGTVKQDKTVKKSVKNSKPVQKRNVASEIAVKEENEQFYIRKINQMVFASSAHIGGQEQTYCIGKKNPSFIWGIASDFENSETKIRVDTIDGKVVVVACNHHDSTDFTNCDIYFLNSAENKIEIYGRERFVKSMDLATQKFKREKYRDVACEIDYSRLPELRKHEDPED
jgi:hypothetical protein